MVILANDDKNAIFDSVVAPHLGDAYSLARWLTRSRTDADDVLQESCIRALGAIKQYKGQNARAWVLAIVRNTAYTWLNQKRTSPLVGIEDLTEKERAEIDFGNEQGDVAVDPEAAIIARADAKQLDKLIAALPMEFRETLVLRDLQGLGYREIAEITGVPAGTVMSRLARARQRLMSALREGDS